MCPSTAKLVVNLVINKRDRDVSLSHFKERLSLFSLASAKDTLFFQCHHKKRILFLHKGMECVILSDKEQEVCVFCQGDGKAFSLSRLLKRRSHRGWKMGS